MFNRDADVKTAFAPIAWTVLLAVLLLAGPAAPGLAQEADVQETGSEQGSAETAEAVAEAPAPEMQELRDRVEAAYEVLPVRDGVLLRPRDEYRGVQTVEIAGESVAINGEILPAEAVRGWLGPRADDVQALAGLSVAERRALFGLTGDAEGPSGVEAAPEAPAEAEPTDQPAVEEASPEVEMEAPEAPAPPEVPEVPREPRYRRGSQTGFGSNVYVAEDEVVDDVVVLGGTVTVDGLVDGDAVVVGGRMEINGEVDNDAVVIGGSMHLGPESRVGGDVSAVGGSIHREPGARIGGSIEQVERGWGIGPWWQPLHWSGDWHGWSPWGDVGELFWSLGGLILCALLLAIVLAIGRGGVERLSDRIGFEPVKAGIVGLLVAVLLVPVLIVVSTLLVISIIGIPIFVILLLAFIFVGVPALMVIGLVGYTAVSHRVGVWLGQRFGWTLDGPFAAAFVGLLGLYALTLVGRVLDLFGGPVDFFAAMFLLAGCGVQLVAGCVGFGAVFLHLWARRGRGPQPGGAAVLPPTPGGPAGPPATHPEAEAEAAERAQERAEEDTEFHPPEEQASSSEEDEERPPGPDK